MQPASMIALCLILIIANAPKILNWLAPVYKEPELSLEDYPINYPMEPMFENFDSIRGQIWACEDQQDLNQVYVRLVLFESCYDDSATFTSELFREYFAVEKMILKN